ncbi:MAG: SH3 domain-containing protein [Saprospiraceae bacterium]
MNRSSILALVFWCSHFILAQSQTNAGDSKAYVWSGPGLNLRKTPDFKGEIIAILPYGSTVEVLEYAEIIKGNNDFGEFEMPAEVNLKVYDGGYLEPTYLRWGAWVKAKAKGQEGYLFDAYLSGMQPFEPAFDQQGVLPTVAEGMKAMFAYYAKQRGTLRSIENETIFSDGTFFKAEDSEFESTKWFFPNISEHDGYLLVNYFLFLEKKANTENPEWFKYGGGFNDNNNGSRLSFFYQGHSNWVLNIQFYRETMMIISEWGGD